jgi:hypothetical protein
VPNQNLESRIEATQLEVSDAEEALRVLTLPGAASHRDVIAAARAKLLSAREHLRELNALIGAAELDQASAAVVNAERNLTKVLDELLAPKRTTIATVAVLEALERLESAKVRLCEVQELTRSDS